MLRAPLAVLLALLALRLAPLSPAQAGPVDDGRKALAERRFADAAEQFAAVLEKTPGSREALLGLASAAAQGRLLERLEAAEGLLSAAVKKGEDAALRLALGEVFLALAPLRTDPKVMEFTFRDAELQFQKALAAQEGSVEAQVGLAKVQYYLGNADEAASRLDQVLEGKPTGPALYWRGTLYYEQARAAYAEDPKAERTLALFRKAKGSYEASVRVDPTSYDGWMQLAYASQYVGDVQAAQDAYVRAVGLDAESPYPLKGLAALLSGRDDAYLALLQRLTKDVPTNVAVWNFLGWAHLSAGRHAEAAKALETYVARARTPGPAFSALGRAYAGAGREEEAVKTFERALAADPRDAQAADELDQRLRKRFLTEAAGSVKAAQACAEAYERLTALTQGNPFVPNNGAFLLREAYGRHAGDGAWLPVLKASTALYEKAAKIVDDMPYDAVEAADWGTRYGWAQITSDTGLMFQFYPATFDAGVAERYYLRALKLTSNGYFDAWNNLHKLYLSQNEHQKAHDLALRAAEGLATESGQPHTTGRKMAQAEAERLVREGKARTE